MRVLFATVAASVVGTVASFSDTVEQLLFTFAQVYDATGLLSTSVPFGKVGSTNGTGHCTDNSCLGSSCYDWATVDGLDRSIKSITSPTLLSLEDVFDDAGLLNVTELSEIQETIDNNDLVDFYQTLETFACCDCDGCMRLANCYQELDMPLSGISCATIWDWVLPTVYSEEELIAALDTLNAGGCYYCHDLIRELDDTALEAVVALDQYDFPWPSSNDETTSNPPMASTTTTIPPTLPDESCSLIGCGSIGTTCSCDVNCERDAASSGIPCCDDYEAESCQEICPLQNYQVDRVEDSTNPYVRYSCDDIVNLFALSDDTERFTCYDLELLYGLDCSGCFCADPPSTAEPTTLPACSNENANCGFGWVAPMSCDSLIAASRETLDSHPDDLQSHLTCASLEDLGCDCTGCGCERTPECAGIIDYSPNPGGQEVLCMGGYSCDYWVQRLPGVTCEILEDDYGCNCNYCECDDTVPESTPEPVCRCEMEYEMEAFDGNGTQIVTCDSMSEYIDEGLCCGVMEYAFQMDCTGCCCEAPTCETCTENTTTTTIPTTIVECPGTPTFYYDCSFDYTCRTDEEIPSTDLFQSVYDCFWINQYLATPEICFPTGSLSCSIDSDCNGDDVCRDAVCSSCVDTIPGAASSSATEEPCYYANHIDSNGDPNPFYTAYDCVNDYLNGTGCIYFDQNNVEMSESFCQITLESIDCPNVPDDCENEVCTPEFIAKGGCTASCGSGTRVFEYTCPLVDENGVDCGMDSDPPSNCVSQGIIAVGTIQVSNCNTEPCDDSQCESDYVGDGFCDWTDEADWATFFNLPNSDLAYNFNVDACDWDGGDCCAYSCQTDDSRAPTADWPTATSRGDVCAFGGGGCQIVDATSRAAAEAVLSSFNPGGGLTSDGLECTDLGDGTFDCCVDMILFNDPAVPHFTCTYGSNTFDCQSQGGHCEDPNAPRSSSSSTSSSAPTTP